MKLIPNPNDTIFIETQENQLKIDFDRKGKIYIDGFEKNQITCDDLVFENELKKFEDELRKSHTHHWDTKERIPKAIEFIKNYVNDLHDVLHLDKSVLFLAIEKNRDYSYSNYYNQCNFPKIKDISTLKEEICNLNKEIFDLKNKQHDLLIEWQKKVTKARKISIEKIEATGEFDFSHELFANCPFCDEYEEIDLSYYEGDREFDTVHTCSKCGKPFSVKAERY